MSNKAVILLSGGLDSATCLGLAKAEGLDCYALTFDYGQRHRYEITAAQTVARSLAVIEHKIVAVDLRSFGGSALTDDAMAVPTHVSSMGIPVTYVPARNTLFLAFALGYAEVKGATQIFIGSSFVDYSGYPDCRPEYFEAFQTLANLATKAGVEGQQCTIRAPLLHLSKAQTIQAGAKVGVDYSLTISCYNTTADGMACGSCDSCYYRRKGFSEAGVADPTCYTDSKVS